MTRSKTNDPDEVTVDEVAAKNDPTAAPALAPHPGEQKAQGFRFRFLLTADRLMKQDALAPEDHRELDELLVEGEKLHFYPKRSDQVKNPALEDLWKAFERALGSWVNDVRAEVRSELQTGRVISTPAIALAHAREAFARDAEIVAAALDTAIAGVVRKELRDRDYVARQSTLLGLALAEGSEVLWAALDLLAVASEALKAAEAEWQECRRGDDKRALHRSAARRAFAIDVAKQARAIVDHIRRTEQLPSGDGLADLNPSIAVELLTDTPAEG